MKQTLTVHLSPDFYILCDFFNFTPEEVLQFYINHITLSVFADRRPQEPMSTAVATFFFGKYSVPHVSGKPL